MAPAVAPGAQVRRAALALPYDRLHLTTAAPWGVLAAAGVLTIIPGALVIWFVRNYIARGFALGRV